MSALSSHLTEYFQHWLAAIESRSYPLPSGAVSSGFGAPNGRLTGRLMQQPFTKMHGLGNDFVVIRGGAAPGPDTIRSLADRHTGIGFDQLLWLTDSPDAGIDVFYRIFNADGGEVEQCGNGARCVARFIAGDTADTDYVWKLACPGGIVQARIQADGDVAVSMGEPDFNPANLPFIAPEQQQLYSVAVGDRTVKLAAVSMGNPHAVIEVADVSTAPVEQLGPLLERHERFPNRANIGFMQVVSDDRIRLRVFERGVGETSACGTGACAAVAAGFSQGKLSGDVMVALPGGELRVRWAGPGSSIWLIGEAVKAFEGIVEYE